MRIKLFAFLLLVAVPFARAEALRVYFVGNSVTDTVRYGALEKLADARGIKMVWGRHMIPGAPLEWLYGHPDDGFIEQPFGGWKKALNDFAWDAVVLHLRMYPLRPFGCLVCAWPTQRCRAEGECDGEWLPEKFEAAPD